MSGLVGLQRTIAIVLSHADVLLMGATALNQDKAMSGPTLTILATILVRRVDIVATAQRNRNKAQSHMNGLMTGSIVTK